MVLAELSIYPVDKGISLSPYVARAVKIIKKSGLNYHLGPMGTSIEGDFDDVMKVVSLCFRELEKDCDRIIINLKVDYRKGRTGAITGKVKSVQSKL